ncbi:hypothetical protein OHA37_15315 [Streptomyces sp. NBC_00335]|uniref:hypothetical protein n=1 Tax=unclassified Streptomyces TaxID=2593676 RepID=UPI002255A069|nr:MULTISPECIES: hypothetical protein [unclassified Streptomyces]MCX5405250.1 hypothetical protein [Streptomyces sp. NBC_00086]
MNDTEQLLKQVAGRAHRSHQGRYGATGIPAMPLPALLPGAEPHRVEAASGFALPPLLAALHTRVADGGFGPGRGLLPPAVPGARRRRIHRGARAGPRACCP